MRQVSQKKDANHDAIVDAYRKRGCLVASLARCGNGVPDLLIGLPGRLALVEIKTPRGRLKPLQEAFGRLWPVRVVRSVEDVQAHVKELTR